MLILRLFVTWLALLTMTSQAFGDETWDALSSLQRLAGTWKIERPTSARERDLRIVFLTIASNSAVVETFARKQSQPTQTVYHRDGSRVIATHYCAQGNQPRLQLTQKSDAKRLEFEFVDATNLESAAQSHLVQLTFEQKDERHLHRDETYSTDGQTETTALDLVRVE